MREPPAPRTRMPRLAATGAIVVALVVAACGGSSSSSSSTSTATNTPAGTVTGRGGGFTTIIPPGFVNGAAALGSGPINLLYAALGPSDSGFRPNINVVREPSRGLTDPDSVAHREIIGLKAVAPHAHGFTALRSVKLDGAPDAAAEPLGE